MISSLIPLLVCWISLGAAATPPTAPVGLVTAPAGATARAPERPDTLWVAWSDILRLADEHPRLAAARQDVLAARGAAAAAGTLPNPTLDATLARGIPPYAPASDREWSVELALPLGWLVQRGYRVGDARAQLEAVREDARAVHRDALLELRSLFWTLARDQARVAALESLGEQTRELVRVVSRRVERGEARPAEATRAEIELQKVLIELEADRARWRARQQQARLWIRGSEGRELRMAADLATIPAVPELDVALGETRARHPDIRAARARVRGLSAALGLENLLRLPAVEVRGFTEGEPDRRVRGGGVSIAVPLWDWNSGRCAQARAQLESGRRQLDWEIRRTESAVIETHAANLAAARKATRYRDEILPRAESAAAVMERAYRLGEANLLEVMDARRVLVETRLDYLDALTDAQIASSQLAALTGQEDAS